MPKVSTNGFASMTFNFTNLCCVNDDDGGTDATFGELAETLTLVDGAAVEGRPRFRVV